MGKEQLTDNEKAQIIEGRDHGVTIQEFSTKFDKLLSVVCSCNARAPSLFT